MQDTFVVTRSVALVMLELPYLWQLSCIHASNSCKVTFRHTSEEVKRKHIAGVQGLGLIKEKSNLSHEKSACIFEDVGDVKLNHHTKSALAGNRTRVARVAGEHSTTEPPMLGP
jgi:hypothetical protein